VCVCFIPVAMLVGMLMFVPMVVLVFMFVFSFHFYALLSLGFK
jgi:hypothetical protein